MAKGKEITLSEFMNWLSGIEEFKDKSWSPDAGEWKRIRAKMKTITEPDPVTVPVHQNPAQQFAPPGYQSSQQAPQSNLGLPPGLAPPPDVPSSIPASAIGLPPPAGANKPVGLQKKTGDNGEVVMKTPDIDGEYRESTFS